MVEVDSLPETYQRGYRHVFSPRGVEGAMPSITTKHVDKGKEKVIEAVMMRRTFMKQKKNFSLLTYMKLKVTKPLM